MFFGVYDRVVFLLKWRKMFLSVSVIGLSFPGIDLCRRKIKFLCNSNNCIFIELYLLKYFCLEFCRKLPALIFHSYPLILNL